MIPAPSKALASQLFSWLRAHLAKCCVVVIFFLIAFHSLHPELGTRLTCDLQSKVVSSIQQVGKQGLSTRGGTNLELSDISAQIAEASISAKALSSSKFNFLQDATLSAIDEEPTSAASWKVASGLINLKFNLNDLPESFGRNCLDSASVGTLPTRNIILSRAKLMGEEKGVAILVPVQQVVVRDCDLDLDEDGQFSSTRLGRYLMDVYQGQSPHLIGLTVSNAHIIYSGKKLLPLADIHFLHCSFEYRFSGAIPTPGARGLTIQLLKAKPAIGLIRLSM